MIRSEFPVGLLLLQEMVNDNQDAMSQSHDGFLLPHALTQSLVIRTQTGALATCSGVGDLNESLAEPSVPFSRLVLSRLLALILAAGHRPTQEAR